MMLSCYWYGTYSLLCRNLTLILELKLEKKQAGKNMATGQKVKIATFLLSSNSEVTQKLIKVYGVYREQRRVS